MKKALLILLSTSLLTFSLNAEGMHIEGVKGMLEEAKLIVKVITPEKLKSLLDDDEDMYIIDIRESNQVAHGEIYSIDSFKISRGYLEFQVETNIPDKDSMIIVYCCTGQRSLLAVHSMLKMGYKNVYSLEGGIKQWVEQGYPLDTAYGEMTMFKE